MLLSVFVRCLENCVLNSVWRTVVFSVITRSSYPDESKLDLQILPRIVWSGEVKNVSRRRSCLVEALLTSTYQCQENSFSFLINW